MNLLSTLLISLSFTTPALAAKTREHQYKVENKKEEEKQKSNNEYHYDSLENGVQEVQFAKTNIWNLRPKLSFSSGFHVDKAVINDGKTNRLFFNTAIHFLNKPLHRVNVNAQLMQNNSLFIGASWEFTPSRERARTYYGFGVAHRLVSEKHFSTFVEFENYYATAQYGMEVLLSSNDAWSVEVKGFLGSENYAVQLSGGYIILF